MKKYLSPNFKSFRFSFHPKSFLFLIVFVLSQNIYVFGQSIPCETNHVIILIDRSSDMEPEKGEKVWNDIFKSLDDICFNTSNDRPLLIPNHDYLSIVSFGKMNENNLNNYINTGNFGYAFKRDFTKSSIDDFKKIIKQSGLRVKNGGFFRFKFGYPTIALPYTVKFLGEKYTNQEFNKTYIIQITDKVQNKTKESNYELGDEDTKIANEADKIRVQLEENFTIVKIDSICKEYRREKNPNKNAGDYYYLDVSYLKPSKGINLDNILDIKLPFELSRFSDKYCGKLYITKKENENFTAKNVVISYKLNNKTIKKDTIVFLDDVYNYISNIDVLNYKNGDSLVAEVFISTQYKNDFYKGTIVTEEQYSNLKKSINGRFETKENFLFFISLNNSIFKVFGFVGSQKSVVILINILFLLILLGFVWIYIRYLSNQSYPAKIKQFEITIGKTDSQ